MADNLLTWTAWRNGGEEILRLRDLAPSLAQPQFAAAWRLFDAGEDERARADVLELLIGAEEGARLREEEGE